MSIHKYKLMYDLAARVSQESTCLRMASGSIIFTPDFHIISTGFNGAPHGLDHCTRVGCLLIDNHCARSVHSEANAVIQSSRVGGAALLGMYIATTNFPCPVCAIILLQAGIKRIYYRDIAPTYSEQSRELVKQWCDQLSVVLLGW